MVIGQTKLKRMIRQQLWAADPHCWYCGLELAAIDSTVDHVIPRRRRGRTDADNLRLACERCNQAKGISLLSEIGCAVPRGAGVVRIHFPESAVIPRGTETRQVVL